MRRICYAGTTVSLLGLIGLCLAWELWLAPLRPGGSWLALKALPLLLPLRGVLKRDVYTLQWSSMLMLLYLAEGVVRGMSDTATTSATLGWIESALSFAFYLCAILYVRPFKQAARAKARTNLPRD
ncbi:DUF2069 domain-containing protein [Pandoraea sp.]|uniref:DUF2069 domain-containing protein n=1 Tax=Pandoraea sp. TaxID=1883445 RepID=UPI001208C78D|nr:DUF2069 domain-containing protein [Pandoraea sp.]TAL55152.1 MAG: DUF2069 domain-containing protein [Pandoraea sp.]TAM18882.1 MAG: DUF2069 domain-containing protein [Pandoraea sp.]